MSNVEELTDVQDWRMKQLERAGVPKLYAQKLARSGSDLHEMLKTYAAGCSLQNLLKIYRDIEGGE